MSVKADHSEDEEGNHGPEVTVLETNRFGFILGNGETDSDGPCPELVRHRESKWLSLMTQWEQVMEKKSNKVKGQCQKGIPASVRAKGWPLLCGAKDRKDKNHELYQRLVEAPDHQGWTDVIKRDTDRQFPFHEMFQSKDGHGQKDLLEVLKAYTQYRPDEGYCQAQGPVAAVLLMNMPAEEAFWCLVQISELYLPGYYSPLLEGVLFDAAVLSSVLKKLCPAAHKHLQNQGVEPLMFATDWLMCLYSRHLPFNTLLRVWDLFFCYGVRVLFQVAVVLVRRCLGEGRQRKECEGQMETLERLRGVKERVQNEQTDAFIHEVCSVSLSLSDLQKQTDKELEKWKKDRPNSTFDPRGRCYGYRMAWERVQDKQKEHEKKERQKGSLIIPLMRSHSSLSPSVLRKKWRKRSSKTDTEEWDGGGRKFSRSLVEESDEEEMRRKSVCGVVGEQRDKRDRLADELCTHKHKDRNTHPNISVVVSSSIDSDVFEKEHEEASLNQQKDNSATTQGDEKERCVVEETHHHEQITNQDELSKQTQGHQDEQNIEKDRGQDEQTVEEKTLEPEESSPVETSQEEDIQTVFSKQEEETQPDSNIQEVEIQTEHCERQEETENRLPIVIKPEDNLQNEESIPEKEVQIHVVQDKTSSDQQENSERQKEKDLYMHTPTEEEEEPGEKHEGFQQLEFNVLPEEEIKEAKEITEPSKMCEEKDDKRLGEERQDLSLEERDNNPLQTSEASFLQTEEEHPERSADPVQQSQSSEPEHNDMDATVTSEELVHCPMDSTVRDTEGSGNPEQIESDPADDTNTLEPNATVASRHSEHSDNDAAAVATSSNSEIDPENSEEIKSPGSENTICCEVNTTEESSNPTHNPEDDTILSERSNGMHVSPESGNPESNTINFTSECGKESNGVEIIVESGNPESNLVDSAISNLESNVTDVIIESEKTECNEVEIAVESGNPESNTVDSAVGKPECSDVHVTSGSGNPDNNIIESDAGSGNPNSNIIEYDVGSGNQECSDVHVTTGSGNPDGNIPECSDVHVITGSVNPDSNIIESDVGSGNPDGNIMESDVGSGNPECSDVHVATGSGNPDGNIIESDVGSGNPECSDVHVTTRSGNPESDKDDSAVVSGNPGYKEATESDNPETNRDHVTAVSGNPECNTEDCTAGSGNPTDSECAIPGNSQGLESPFLIQSSKSPNPNVPPAHLCVRRTSSSRVSYPTILSEDTFREPQQQEHTPSENTTHTLTQDTHAQPSSPTKSDNPKRLGLFRRLRGETSKTTIPKILIQDFSEKEEKLTAKERRRRKREKERKEREEKDRKKREKELEKDKGKERKKPQTRGKSFQVLSRKCANDVVSTGNSDSQTSRSRRNSDPFSDNYF
ncbi:probable histone-lysine N-methyltransferase CG1716 isoform X1 [Pimephales promelas]|uniref:probable histone-lysine N-methyltransferase CG1716 isoform X1 n=1 Tax=Pimephales promelas TaxID=90988 RepID=UPI001955DF42|nr:probable histone-lysine N-methyltransferase CG1716 isoform X1 [Pimephales promelas]